MTVISINVVDVAGSYSPGDVVNLRSPVLRGDGDQVVQTAWHPVPLSEGGVGSVTVSPGPLEVQLDCRGVSESTPLVVTVPDVESITLRHLLEQSFTYEPPVVSEFAELVERAEAASLSASWEGDRLTVLGATSPPLTGDDGETPYVGANGNWFVGTVDTGVPARGEKGDPGDGSGDVLWSELNPVLDGKADVGHTHTPESLGAAEEDHDHLAEDISDATTVGRSVLTAASTAAARQAIGAGTSNLALGTTSATAAPGNHTHSQYATTAQVEARTPEIRVVTTIPTSPTPGVVYLRFG